jgi:hypothetical protein
MFKPPVRLSLTAILCAAGLLNVGWEGQPRTAVRKLEFPLDEAPNLKVTALADWMLVPAETLIRDLP